MNKKTNFYATVIPVETKKQLKQNWVYPRDCHPNNPTSFEAIAIRQPKDKSTF